MSPDDFDFELPPAQIAQTPLPDRAASRLLSLTEQLRDGQFRDLPTHLRPGDLLVVNDTRVIKARIHARKDSGGAAEVLLERILGETEALAQVRVSKALKEGRALFCGAEAMTVLGREGPFYRLRTPLPVLEWFEAHGEVPLPPYIERAPELADERSYQTVYAGTEAGAVAAPTAGLHFDDALLARLAEQGVARAEVTLHVGAGTFTPVRGDLESHRMHTERYRVSEAAALAIEQARERGGRVIAVGTTVVRTLESAAHDAGCVRPGSGETTLFIRPGFRFRVVDALVTNFHLPRSTLMMLVCAFGGQLRVLDAYRHAVAAGYRFFSYGDAMYMTRNDHV
ncbi:MAG: tRNA preQ1(34) S-adenosylmethionine ribosyltransferase-isomerase QueA [Pseudomonadota bacterium]